MTSTARTDTHVLTEVFLRQTKKAGSFADKNGLEVRIEADGEKRWVWNGVVGGARRRFEFGEYPRMKLATARECARLLRVAAEDFGMHPEDVELPPPPTFREVANSLTRESYPRRVVTSSRGDDWTVEDVMAGVVTLKWVTVPMSGQEKELRSALRRHAIPRIGELPVREVTEWHVMWCLSQVWRDENDEGMRALGCMVDVLDHAVRKGYRPDNPIRPDAVAYNMDVVTDGPQRYSPPPGKQSPKR